MSKANAAGLTLATVAGAVAMADAAFNTSYEAEVLRVIDGDTVEVAIELLPGMVQEIDVRERNLDTPEKRRGRGGAACDEELAKGREVSALVQRLLPPGTKVGVENIGLGKYAGRAVGDIKFRLPGQDELIDLGDWLIGQGFAVEYDGGTKIKPWCPIDISGATDAE